MERIDNDTIQITQKELDDISRFIDDTLERIWNTHADTYVCRDSWESGKRWVNPKMYDMMKTMKEI